MHEQYSMHSIYTYTILDIELNEAILYETRASITKCGRWTDCF